VYIDIACRQSGIDDFCHARKDPVHKRPAHYTSAVSIGADISSYDVQQKLRGWKRHSNQVGLTRLDSFSNRQGDSILAIDGMVELYTTRQIESTRLREHMAMPSSVVPTPQGQIWTYGSDWSVVVVDDRVVELWLGK